MDVQKILGMVVVGASLMLGACASDTGDEWGEDNFRNQHPDDDDDDDEPDAGPAYAGNGPIAVHEGATTSQPGCLLWDLIDGSTGQVNNGPAANGQLGQLIMIERPGTIADVGTGEICTIVYHPNNAKKAKLLDGDGNVVLSVKNKKVFDGDFSQMNGPERNAALLYKFKKDHIQDGQTHEILMTATTNVDKAAAWRKLAIGALAGGYCGGNGLPNEDSPPHDPPDSPN